MTISHGDVEASQFFASSFLALTGYPPMPWQARLFGAHFVSGSLPEAVSIPTGLGKTAVMAVWLIGLAWQMRNQTAPSLPRRLVYVVDRRAVVDQSTTFAEKLREALATPAANELRTALGFTEDQKLAISTLRGQFVDNREWLEDPSRPSIIVGTVDMIGSRLLFEGYGVSRRMRPYHAGLLGADSLVMLDEAHLVPPFEALLATIASGPHVYGARTKEDRKRVPEFKLLPLSATNRHSSSNVFALEAQDYHDPADEGAKRTRKRLDAVKHLRIETDGIRDLSHAIAERAWAVSGKGVNGGRCLIYCDKRDDAQKVFDDLLDRLTTRARAEMKKAKGESKEQHEVRVSAAVHDRIELFVGARRVRERQQAQKRLEALGFLADSTSNLPSATYLVATSAGEVGVDLDADHLVCDLVAWERMVQRFGRVNRRGRVSSDILIVAPPPDTPKTKVPDKPKIAVLSDLSKPVKPKKPGKKATPEEHGAYSHAISRFNREEADYKEALKQFKDTQKRQKKAEDYYQEALANYREDWAPTNLYKERISLLERLNGDASPRALLHLLAKTVADTGLAHAIHACSTAVPLRPALSRPLVDAWSMTSLDEHTGRPRVEPWLRGWVPDLPQTAVVWREHLPARTKPPASKKEIEDFFEAAPILAVESLETETYRVLDWLIQRVAKLLDRSVRKVWDEPAEDGAIAISVLEQAESTMENAAESDESGEEAPSSSAAPDSPPLADVLGSKLKPDDVIAMILSARGEYERTLHVRDIPAEEQKSDTDAQKKRAKEAKTKLLGELSSTTLVIRADLGGIKNGLLDLETNTAASAADGSTSWGADDNGNPLIPFRIHDSVAGDPSSDGNWRACLRFDLERNADGEAIRWFIVEEWPDSANTEDRRSSGPEQSLVEHQSWAERCARRIGIRLGLEGDYLEMLVIASRLHDEGKQASRWQNAFRAKRDGRPYAKTKGPIDFKLLDGYRHEFGSLPYALMDEAFKKLSPDLQDLALHLIAAHHGFARPVIGINGCEDAPPSALETRAREVALRFARLQRRWGPWGLAWWEALLRAADQQASRENDARGRKSNKDADR